MARKAAKTSTETKKMPEKLEDEDKLRDGGKPEGRIDGEDAGLKLKGASSVPKALDSNGKQVTQPLTFSIDVSPQRRLYTIYGIIGRGTTVIPIKVAGHQATAKALRVESDMPLVAKLAWQHVGRKEDALLRRIRRAIRVAQDAESKSILKHVVDMKCSLSLSMDSPCIHLPRAFMSALPKIHGRDLREFRLLILEAYEPLANLTKVDDFKKVFLETFKAHHWIWTNAGVLHRDISNNNVMFRRRGDQVEGVLCDWDLSSTKEDLDTLMNSTSDMEGEQNVDLPHRQTDIANTPKRDAQPADDEPESLDEASDDISDMRQRARYRTGTGPFMALELLYTPAEPPIHKYRFDVQSFFWLLCWVAARHNPDKKKLGKISQWLNKDMMATYYNKHSFITKPGVRQAVFKASHPSYQPLISSWIEKLRILFRTMVRAFDAIEDLRDDMQTSRLANDMQEVNVTAASIALKEREIEETITYESFLAALV
ncbi:hypothetical protein K474DRAFT_1708853 [Panus rudis PR-1116 ss-1]|nr:hypothetical protein K474DRAFT_1708853 [Panus rudis PR-1116 ss-1]